MSDLESAGSGNGTAEAKIPGKESLRAPLARRSYKSVSIADRGRGFAVLLDGKTVKTPKKADLVLPTRALAEAVAGEWAAQGERIDPATMALTRIANTAIDAVADNMRAVAADIAAFAGSDAVCYRAKEPEGLVARQRARWDPVVAWAREELGAGLALTSGIVHVAQPQEALDPIRKALDRFDPFRLTSLHVMTTLTSSAVLALAIVRGRLTMDEAWAAAHVDEDWQVEQWGSDAEAEARRKKRLSEFEAAGRFFTLAGERS